MNQACPHQPVKEPVTLKRIIKAAILLTIGALAGFLPVKSFAQAPALTYASPQTFYTGLDIGTLRPSPRTGLSGPNYDISHHLIAAGLLPQCYGMGRDAAGNLYCPDYVDGVVYEAPSTGVKPFVVATLTHPYGCASDAAGDFYNTAPNEGLVYRTLAGGASTVVASGLNFPTGLAVDSRGNVYVAENGANRLVEIPINNGPMIVLGTFPGINCVAIDGNDNIYTTDGGTHIIRMPPGGGTPVTLPQTSAASAVTAMAVDGDGNIFVNNGQGILNELINDGNGTMVSITSGFGGIYGLAVDGIGHVFVMDLYDSAIAQLNPTGGMFISPMLPPGLHFDGSVFGDITGIPTAASPATNYKVTAYNASGSGQATVNITVKLNPASLTKLKLSAGTLSPAFVSSTQSYTATVPFGTTSITVTPTVAVTTSTIAVNGSTVSSGAASGPIMLSVGQNTISTVVTPTGGAAAQTYTVTVTRRASSVATLSQYAISNGTLSPAFSSATTSYTANVPNNVTSFTITPTATDAGATIAINGVAITSGTTSASIGLPVGTRSVNTKVTAADGVTTRTYVLNINRAPSNNANLSLLKISSGTLSPVFNASTHSYTASVPSNVSSVDVTPTAANSGAMVTVNNEGVSPDNTSVNVALNAGANTITIHVTAEDGVTTSSYTIVITRASSNNDNLSALHLSNGVLSPSFAGAVTTSYTASVGNTISSITVTPTAVQSTSTIKVNGITVTSGSPSGGITLSIGANTISIKVTAQDGVTNKTYTVMVTRAASNNDNLSALHLSVGTLSPAFAGATTTSYTASVASTVSSITVTPTTVQTTSTVKVNGVAVTSGSPSGAITLSVGSNTITSIVTAQDGTTKKTYTVTVTRASGPVNIPDESVAVEKPVLSPQFAGDGITVHQGITPNGDGKNDVLVIEGINNYPDNKLTIINRNGALVYEAKGYDNQNKAFDGHSNRNGQMQLAGTYFYSLEYTVNGQTKHKTGFLVLKY